MTAQSQHFIFHSQYLLAKSPDLPLSGSTYNTLLGVDPLPRDNLLPNKLAAVGLRRLTDVGKYCVSFWRYTERDADGRPGGGFLRYGIVLPTKELQDVFDFPANLDRCYETEATDEKVSKYIRELFKDSLSREPAKMEPPKLSVESRQSPDPKWERWTGSFYEPAIISCLAHLLHTTNKLNIIGIDTVEARKDFSYYLLHLLPREKRSDVSFYTSDYMRAHWSECRLMFSLATEKPLDQRPIIYIESGVPNNTQLDDALVEQATAIVKKKKESGEPPSEHRLAGEESRDEYISVPRRTLEEWRNLLNRLLEKQ